MTEATKKGKPLSAGQRRRLIQCFRDFYAQFESGYPAFVDEARKLLPNDAGDSRFPFVVRMIWMNWAGELANDWEERLAQDYKRLCVEHDWSIDGAPNWITVALVHRTLALYQRRYPVRITTTEAVAMIQRADLLQDLLGRSA